MARSVSRLTTTTCRSRGIRRQPVPSSLLLLAAGAVGLASRVRRNEGVKSWPLTGTGPFATGGHATSPDCGPEDRHTAGGAVGPRSSRRRSRPCFSGFAFLVAAANEAAHLTG